MSVQPPDLSPDLDPRDEVQRASYSALSTAVDKALESVGVWQPGDSPSFVARTTFQLVGHLVQLMATAWKLLTPGEQTFAYASGVSLCLRSISDVHAKLLAIWDARDPDARLDALLSDSLRQELLALDVARSAGSEVDAARRELETLQSRLGPPYGVNVVDVLTGRREWEALAVYRWESAHVHTGAAALAAGGRTLGQAETTADVAMWPVSLWRVGQLTWATYGLGMRALSQACSRIDLELDELWEADSRMRLAARSAALQLRPQNEPPSIHYGSLSLPLWS